MRILFFGDIFGRPGRGAVRRFIEEKKSALNIDLVVGNSDNISSGKGPIEKTYKELLNAGLDVLTCGDHVWDNKDVLSVFHDRDSKLIRPLNYPTGCPGKGAIKVNIKGQAVLVVNLLGRVFTTEGLESPFVVLDEVLAGDIPKIIIVDFHAEATSEKNALSQHFAGKVSAVLGTHTHVQTADEKILREHTGYISDVGMCGPYDSVIGVDKERSISRFLTAMPMPFEVADGPAQINAVVLEIDENTGATKSIERINEILD